MSSEIFTFFFNLWKLLSGMGHVIQKHSASIVRIFLRFMYLLFEPTFPPGFPPMSFPPEILLEVKDHPPRRYKPGMVSRIASSVLTAMEFLKNPQSLIHSDFVLSSLTVLLSHSDTIT